jgi:anti-sigma regulatory factor (Ser/Thr protein kinase)
METSFTRAINGKADVEAARRQTRSLVLNLGFSTSDAEKVVLAVSELATNLLRYAKDGQITVSATGVGSKVGVLVESVDTGPGIDDIDRALTDGFSTAGGLGGGLSGVNRLMDDFTITSDATGTQIATRKWLPSGELKVAASARSYPGELVSGDAWRMDRIGTRCRIAVIDGLGHGPEAAAASAAATTYLAEHPDLEPAPAIEGCHHALRGTRGAAIGIAWIDTPAQRLLFAGVGNVEARLWQAAGRERRLSSARGIVGSVLPSIRPDELSITNHWRLVLHSDGVSARFHLGDLTLKCASIEELSETILAGWGRARDDATVVVVGSDRGEHESA